MIEELIDTREYAIELRLLREAREQARIRQLELTGWLRMSQSFVTKMERADQCINIAQLRAIYRIYGSTLIEFVKRLETELANGR